MKPYPQMNAWELQESLSHLQGRLSAMRLRACRTDQLELDLEVHQVELEMQNRELKKAVTELEASRAVYAELYDSVPVACVTLDRIGVMHQMNLAAASLLGGERDRLLGRTLITFLAPDDRWPIQELLLRYPCDASPQSLDISLYVQEALLPARLLIGHQRHSQSGRSLISAAIVCRDVPQKNNSASPQDALVASGHSSLSEREELVVRLIAQGYSNKEIAAHLSLSVKTIETHKARSLKKLGLHSRAELVRYAVQWGWLENLKSPSDAESLQTL
jgi:DNA-binding CsgD family transcriptional regulator